MVMQRNPSRQRQANATQSLSFPAPIGGWNARDSLDQMKETDAVRLENWFPNGDRVSVRQGFAEHATGVGAGEVETVIEFVGLTSRKLIAASGTNLYDATAAGAASSLAGGFTSGRWQGANFGNRLILVNGADAPQSFDGTTMAAAGFTGPTTVSDLIYAVPFKGRLYFVEKNTGDVWYGGIGAVTGALTKFQLSRVLRRGGELQAIGVWSRDAGDGLDDFIVFVSSNGEVLVYGGTDPATDFAKIGSYEIGRPLGRRCMARAGGELIILTRAGYLPVSLLLQGGTADTIDRHPVWGKVRPAAADATAMFEANFGWQIFSCPTGCALHVNIPSLVGSEYKQHVLNTVTGAWALYSGVPARAFGAFDGDTYFGGGDGRVFKIGGNTDDGAAIRFRAKQAFSYLRKRTSIKRFTMSRPVIRTDGTVLATVGLDVDFADRNLPQNLTSFASGVAGSAWDTDDWDVGVWAGAATPASTWLSTPAVGRSASVRFEGEANAQTLDWYSTDVLAQTGGVR